MALDTIAIASGAADERIIGQGASYPPPATAVDDTNTFTAPNRSRGTGSREINVACFNFPTSGVVPVVNRIKTLTLRFWVQAGGIANSNSLSVTADYFTYTQTVSDYSTTALTTAHAGKTLASFTAGALNNMVLLNPNSFFNRSGNTGVRLHMSGGEPPADENYNYLLISTFEDTNPEAVLIVEHYAPTRIAPDQVVSRTNLPNVDGVAANDAVALAAVDEDPDSGGTDWLTI